MKGLQQEKTIQTLMRPEFLHVYLSIIAEINSCWIQLYMPGLREVEAYWGLSAVLSEKDECLLSDVIERIKDRVSE